VAMRERAPSFATPLAAPDSLVASAIRTGTGGPKCPACGSWAAQPFDRYSHPLMRCQACGLLWQREPPVGDDLIKLYTSGFYTADEPPAGPVVNMIHALNNAVRLYELRGIPRGRILDVGCGKGRFLSAATTRGWRGVGIEYAPTLAAKARARGLDVREGDFLNVDIDGEFDVITMWHVLEHLPDPAAGIVRARELLRPTGHLVISVPNIESAQARLGGGNWFHLDLPRHIFHFSPAALTALLARQGFSVERIGHFQPEMEAVGFVQTVMNGAGLDRDRLYRFLKGDPEVNRSLGLLFASLVGAALLPAAAVWTATAPRMRLGASIQVVATVRNHDTPHHDLRHRSRVSTPDVRPTVLKGSVGTTEPRAT
jgi:SAM-dependent methyltransferase